MLNIIKKIKMQRHWQRQIQAEKRLDDLCQKAGKQVAVLYDKRGTDYDILAEVEQMLEGRGK